jgi:methylated-DNA-[protein]-cysteine S-methyltransferase
VRIAYHMMSSPVGLLFLARTENGLRYLQYMERKSLKRMIAARSTVMPDATWEPSLLDLKDVVEQLDAYFNGMLQEFEVTLDTIGSDFQHKVWKALPQIPYGQTRTYGQIAKSIRQPRASRAVGLANNQNPIAIIVPCHRVIGADGSMTGYGGGLPRKRWLLEHEARFAALQPTTQDLFVGASSRTRR